MMVYFRKRLPEVVVNKCNESIVRHGLKVIRSSDTHGPGDDNGSGSGSTNPADKSKLASQKQSNQGSLLIDVTCMPVDIRHPTDLSLLNDAIEVTEILIDAMHPQVRDSLGHKPRTHSKQASQQFLAVAKKKRPRIGKIPRRSSSSLATSKRDLCSIDALIACGGWLLAAGRHIYQNVLTLSKLIRHQDILYHADSRCIPARIVSLCQADIRPLVRGKASRNVEFGAKISISVTSEVFTAASFCEV